MASDDFFRARLDAARYKSMTSDPVPIALHSARSITYQFGKSDELTLLSVVSLNLVRCFHLQH
jgi:hypothetical protein